MESEKSQSFRLGQPVRHSQSVRLSQSVKIKQSVKLSLSSLFLFSVLISDCIELDFKENSYLVTISILF